ncbi:MAG: cbb3-type cytochrome c oxidase subunit 3 [Desulfuromonadales bacterium]|nr:cbb3-type cytochrome c oxidase subunit 3 [Desulfuromonadales bacterium]
MMIDARLVFLLLTALLLAILVGIAFATMRKKRKEKLEEPKYRMLKDD